MRIGSLCSGYGGLDRAVEELTGGEVVWVSDIDKGACKILAHRYPGVPNLGDFTNIDWSELVSCKPDLETTYRMYDEYCQGKSLAAVGKLFDVSRQTVYTRFVRQRLNLRARKPALPHIEYAGRRFTLGFNGYYRATEGDRAYLHRTVWEMERGPIPDDWDVHHRDHDKTNNHIDNLHCLSKADHTRLHATKEVMPTDSHAIDILTAGYP